MFILTNPFPVLSSILLYCYIYTISVSIIFVFRRKKLDLLDKIWKMGGKEGGGGGGGRGG